MVSRGTADDDERRNRNALRAMFERELEKLSVATGPAATRKWYRMTYRNPLAISVDQRLDLIHWCVLIARDRGRTVNYASDVADLVDQWIPANHLAAAAAEA